MVLVVNPIGLEELEDRLDNFTQKKFQSFI